PSDGFSIFITRAPRPPRRRVATGPERATVRSRTVTSLRGHCGIAIAGETGTTSDAESTAAAVRPFHSGIDCALWEGQHGCFASAVLLDLDYEVFNPGSVQRSVC